MSFERTEASAEILAERAAQRARERIVAAAKLPRGVTATLENGSIILSGKNLRSRFINDPRLRNFTHE
jgi:hypothetical protein